MTADVAPSRHTVLVVDDDAQVVRTLSDIMSRDGFAVLTALDAAQALAVLEKSLPCLILLDVQMPGMDGLELCRRIKTDPRTSHVPVTLVTARADSADVEAGIAAGATDYIKKPFDKDDVRMRVRLQIRTNDASRAARESAEKFRTLVEGLKGEYFFYRHDTNGVFTYVSPSIAHVLGYSPEEFCVHFETFLTDAPVNQEVARHTAMSLQGIQQPTYEVEIRHRDGSIHRLEVLEFPVFDADGKVVAVDGIAHDITERKQAEAELRESEQLFMDVLYRSEDAILLIGNNTFIDCNEATARMLGYATRQEFLKTHPSALSPPKQPDGRGSFEKAEEMMRLAMERGFHRFEWSHRRANGMDFPVEVSLTPIIHGGKRLIHCVWRDITERKRIEAELGHARKLEAVGQLAAGIAHEINTPTQFVSDSIHFLKEACDNHQELIGQYRLLVDAIGRQAGHEELVARIREAEEKADIEYFKEHVPGSFERCFDGLGRIAAIVGAMKEFAHPDQKEKASADLNQALQATLTIAKNEYKYVADVETELGELPPVTCHIGELNQVFLNLLVNAAHAIADVVGESGDKGKIRVRTRTEGEHAIVEIEDTGTGIPERIRGRIFEPFFTTKEVGKGSGQGLAIAHSVVTKKHGGTLTFRTQEGQGTTFIIRIPVDGKNGKGG